MSEFRNRPPGTKESPKVDQTAKSRPSEGETGLAEKATHAAQAAASQAEAVADRARQQASANLSALAESVKRASEDYGASEPGIIADLVGQAAQGVDALARTVEGRSTADIIGSARSFGRHNPWGLLLGGMAAGFAVSRLAVGIARTSKDAGKDPVGHSSSTQLASEAGFGGNHYDA